MIRRCTDPRHPYWNAYGGRGITVCERWQDFEAYYADTGDRPQGKSLDRVDNDGPYSPDNTRWATPSEQTLNSRHRERVKTHCKSGHPFDEANTLIDTKGYRKCRACHRAVVARSTARKKTAA